MNFELILLMLSNFFIIIYLLNNFIYAFNFRSKKIEKIINLLFFISFLYLVLFSWKLSIHIYDGDNIEYKLAIAFFAIVFFLYVDGIVAVFVNFIVCLLRRCFYLFFCFLII